MVYAKTPLAGPAAVLDYLARYTHRTAIGNERLVAIAGDKVLLRVRADDTGGKRTVAMRRRSSSSAGCCSMCCHRASSASATTGCWRRRPRPSGWPLARKLLAMPAANPQAREDAQAFMRRVAAIEIECCPHCRLGHWRVVEQRAAPIARPLPRPRSPRAEDRRDAHAQTPATRIGLSQHTGAAVCARLAHVAATGPPAPAHRCRGAPAPTCDAGNPTVACATTQRIAGHCPHRAETYTAHSTAAPAVQSNEVYLTPCTTVPSIQLRRGVR